MLQTQDWKAQSTETFEGAFYSFVPILGEDQLTFSAIDVVPGDFSYTDNADWVPPDQEVISILRESFKQISEVQSICAQFDSNGITIWTLLAAPNRTVRESVYKREMEICERLGIYDFDFRVSSVDLVLPSELVTTGFIEVFRRV